MVIFEGTIIERLAMGGELTSFFFMSDMSEKAQTPEQLKQRHAVIFNNGPHSNIHKWEFAEADFSSVLNKCGEGVWVCVLEERKKSSSWRTRQVSWPD